MKITYNDEGQYARICITGPFWQVRKAKRLWEAGRFAAPVWSQVSQGLIFQITLFGSNDHVLRAHKAIVAERRVQAWLG